MMKRPEMIDVLGSRYCGRLAKRHLGPLMHDLNTRRGPPFRCLNPRFEVPLPKDHRLL